MNTLDSALDFISGSLALVVTSRHDRLAVRWSEETCFGSIGMCDGDGGWTEQDWKEILITWLLPTFSSSYACKEVAMGL